MIHTTQFSGVSLASLGSMPKDMWNILWRLCWRFEGHTLHRQDTVTTWSTCRSHRKQPTPGETDKENEFQNIVCRSPIISYRICLCNILASLCKQFVVLRVMNMLQRVNHRLYGATQGSPVRTHLLRLCRRKLENVTKDHNISKRDRTSSWISREHGNWDVMHA